MGKIHYIESIQLLSIKVVVRSQVAALVLVMEVNERQPLRHDGSHWEPERPPTRCAPVGCSCVSEPNIKNNGTEKKRLRIAAEMSPGENTYCVVSLRVHVLFCACGAYQ